MSNNIEPETPVEKSLPQGEAYVNVTESTQTQLAHTPETRFNWKRFAKSLKSKDAWFGDYVSGEGDIISNDRTTPRCSFPTSLTSSSRSESCRSTASTTDCRTC